MAARKKTGRKSAAERLFKTVVETRRVTYPDPDDPKGEGFWADIAPALRSNPEYRAALNEAQKRYGKLPDDTVQDEPLRFVYARAIVKDWGGDIPYPATEEGIMEGLLDLPELFADFIVTATSFANYREAATGTAAKN